MMSVPQRWGTLTAHLGVTAHMRKLCTFPWHREPRAGLEIKIYSKHINQFCLKKTRTRGFQVLNMNLQEREIEPKFKLIKKSHNKELAASSKEQCSCSSLQLPGLFRVPSFRTASSSLKRECFSAGQITALRQFGKKYNQPFVDYLFFNHVLKHLQI